MEVNLLNVWRGRIAGRMAKSLCVFRYVSHIEVGRLECVESSLSGTLVIDRSVSFGVRVYTICERARAGIRA